jgi:hypothetical protein
MASYEKGAEFLRESKRLGCHVILLTVGDLENAPSWPRESIDELFAMPDLSALDDVRKGVSYLARSRQIDRIVPLDEYDVPTAAELREHLRLPGMGVSLARRFRDKLAMRVQARDGGILVPDFVHVLNNDRITEFSHQVPPPWVLKPRAEASAIGIVKIDGEEQLWSYVEGLGDRRSLHLLERYVPGTVYHVDSLVSGGQVVFAETHRYANPPMDVFHGGGIAMSRTVERGSEDEQLLREVNRHVLEVLAMQQGATHMEFIRGRDDGRFYFLEVGARVGGAHTAEMVEAATGVNLWREWARLEVLGPRYQLPERAARHAGVILSLARQEHPDTSAYDDPEIVYRVDRRHHVGFILVSQSADRVAQLQETYSRRIAEDFSARMPAWESRPPPA